MGTVLELESECNLYGNKFVLFWFDIINSIQVRRTVGVCIAVTLNFNEIGHLSIRFDQIRATLFEFETTLFELSIWTRTVLFELNFTRVVRLNFSLVAHGGLFSNKILNIHHIFVDNKI